MQKQNSKAVSLYQKGQKPLDNRQKRYRLMGIMMFIIACLLLVVRTFVGLLTNFITNDTVIDTIFSLTLQIGVLIGVPLLFYKFGFRYNTKQILDISNIRKTNPLNYVLAVAIGIVAMFVTTGISSMWQMIIAQLGFTHSSAPSTHPEQFNFALFLLSIFLTAVLPGICEEFAVRGGLLTTVRKSFSLTHTLIIMAIVFGLFHQYITQVFYTACFGALAAFIVLKTKSIIPAMIIHFFNNATSVYLDYAEHYGWWGGRYFDNITIALNDSPAKIIFIYILICTFFVGLVSLLVFINSHKRLEQKKAVILDSAFDVTNKKVILMGNENKDLVRELGMETEVYGGKIGEDLYKPTLRDNMFYLGAAAVAIATTIFTFIWGFVM